MSNEPRSPYRVHHGFGGQSTQVVVAKHIEWMRDFVALAPADLWAELQMAERRRERLTQVIGVFEEKRQEANGSAATRWGDRLDRHIKQINKVSARLQALQRVADARAHGYAL